MFILYAPFRCNLRNLNWIILTLEEPNFDFCYNIFSNYIHIVEDFTRVPNNSKLLIKIKEK